MTAADAIAVLRANEGLLRSQGVRHAALFGSRARGSARPDSDLDVLVDIDPALNVGLYAYVGILHAITDLFPQTVDVADLDAMHSEVRRRAEADAIYAF